MTVPKAVRSAVSSHLLDSDLETLGGFELPHNHIDCASVVELNHID